MDTALWLQLASQLLTGKDRFPLIKGKICNIRETTSKTMKKHIRKEGQKIAVEFQIHGI